MSTPAASRHPSQFCNLVTSSALMDSPAQVGQGIAPPMPTTQRIVGVQLLSQGRPTCIFSVYLPTRSGAIEEFREALDQLGAALGLYGLDSDVFVMGDFNADLGRDGGIKVCTQVNEQGRILLRYIRKWNYCSYQLYLSPSQPTATYESEAHSSLSMIDHLLGPTHLLPSSKPVLLASRNPRTHLTIFPSSLPLKFPALNPLPPCPALSLIVSRTQTKSLKMAAFLIILHSNSRGSPFSDVMSVPLSVCPGPWPL